VVVEASTQLDTMSSHPNSMKIQEMLRIPIQRGDIHGLVGNGQAILVAWKIYQRRQDQKSSITAEVWTQFDQAYDALRLEMASEKVYYKCPTCSLQRTHSFL
jgi:hypothetical protein